MAELEIYRPGDEFDPSRPTATESAAQIDLKGVGELETAGVIDSKFGAVMLLRHADEAGGPRSCLSFIKRFDQPTLRISGWSCQGDALPARRAAISCMLDHLVLLTAGKDPKLAELFAHAELKRGGCASATPSAAPADWVTGVENPRWRRGI
ncbi:hypothetical protein [Bradyrhizobium lablabi]|uniref:hypothetical protein n=1 Tax=Bradyrhizobium lablabi TaxID=722472 RepID=UPI0026B4C277